MADDTSKRGAGDRSKVAGEQPYEIGYFAEKHGISRKEAQALIDRIGNDRTRLDAAAAQRSTPPASRRTRASRATTRTNTANTGASAAKPSAKKPRGATAATAGKPMAAITTPVARAVAPVKRQAARAAKDTATTVQRGATKLRGAATKLPSVVRQRARSVGGSAKAAAVSPTAKLVGAAAAGLVAGLAVNLGRKVAVQASSALAGDWFALKVEHKLALTLFDQLQATDDSQSAKRSGLLAQLKHALSKHAFTEENVIYPALREWGDKADADKLNHDHGYVKQSLFELESMDKAAPAFMRKVADFRADLEAHIREEEEAIFPRMRASLSEDRNAALTARANKEGFKLA
jgi:hemerythrin superfamily protein